MILRHKGNYGSVNQGQGIFWGKLLLIEDSVTYEATDVESLKREFILAIEDYQRFCVEIDKKPELPEIVGVTRNGCIMEGIICQPKEYTVDSELKLENVS
jgi:hypothetical protein